MGARESYRFLLRMPVELREPLRAAAERNGRSLNAEIVARLEAGVARPGRRRWRPQVAATAAAAAAVLALAGGGALLGGGAGSEARSDAPAPYPGLKWTLVSASPHATPNAR